MFSGSNSYLGSQSGRPGGPQQYNSFQQGQQPQQQQQQQNAFLNSNPTGYGAPAPLQQNYTGYPMQSQQTGYQPQQQMQPQSTGFPGQQQPSQFNGMQPPQQQQPFQTGAVPPMPSIPPQFQQPQQQQQQPAPPTPVKPQPTGFAAMADSFRTASSPTTTGRGRRSSKANKGARIPSIRLSFITAQDQAKFEQLFKSAVGDGQTLSGDKSRDLLMRSKLDGNSLSQIW